MKMKLTLRLVLALLFCASYSFLTAQTDSSWLDLGRIKLKKEFTQTVTIKGKDLEQMPFANLADALSVWLNGLATSGSLVYVIDGNIMTDANAYSIYDIEEITLVQNALVQLNGATHDKQLVLITTRRNNSKSSGLTVAGSSFAVTNSAQQNNGEKQKAETNFYHQYYLSAWQNRSKIQYGVTAGYQRDVVPYLKDAYDVHKPYQLNRFRFHGYLNATINSANNVWVRAGYIPAKLVVDNESMVWSGTGTSFAAQIKTRESYFTAAAGWRSQISKQLTNELTAGYTPATAKGNSYGHSVSPFFTPPIHQEQNATFKNTVNNLLITDHLAYHVASGNWSYDPSIDVSFRNINSTYRFESNTYYVNSGTMTSQQYKDFDVDNNLLLLTPAVNMSYKNSFNVQAGFVYNMSTQTDTGKTRKILPFATMTMDVFKLLHATSSVNWTINVSYAAAGNFADAYYTLYNVNSAASAYPYPGMYNNNNRPYNFLYGADADNHMVQAGSTVSLSGNRLQFAYNFEKRTYSDTGRYTYGTPRTIQMDNFLTVHRLGVTLKVTEGDRLNWLTGWNVSVVKTKINHQDGPYGTIPAANIQDPVTIMTGGWVNRLQYRQFMLGLDVLYALGHKDYIRLNYGNDSDLSLRNIYAGYRFQLNDKPFDLYAECRNPGQKNENNLPDRRNYFGLGFKAVL